MERQRHIDDQALRQTAKVAGEALASGIAPESMVLHEHGHDSAVAVVDQSVVFKFPRTNEATKRTRLERLVLEKLGMTTTTPTPSVLGAGEAPFWVALDFLPGSTLSYEELRELDSEAQERIGQQIGQFAHELHTHLDAEKIQQVRIDLGVEALDTPWREYLEQAIAQTHFPTEPQDRVAKQIHQEWLEATAHQQEIVVVHDDLHADNLLISDGSVQAVLDFGDTTLGSPEQELRHALWMSDLVAESAASTYEQLSGLTVDRSLIRLWAIVQELAAFSSHSSDHSSHQRARANLQRWFPEVIW